MNNNNNNNNMYRNQGKSRVGIPYKDINWYDLTGQPFGIAKHFNAIVFNDANNIVDVKGAMAVGGNFYSPRGFSLAFGKDAKQASRGFSPDDVRFLVGGNITTGGPLVVVGHVVQGGNFRGASGSTYLIGKGVAQTQPRELAYLYQAKGGSTYWRPSDKGDHYLIPSYDVPRSIPAGRIGANLSTFFQRASESIVNYKNCIQALNTNGTVVDNFHEWILRGNNPQQNVFLIDVRPNGILNKGIRAEVPEGSLVIVKIRTGKNAHLQYGLLGEQKRANHTLYVFEDATNIYMEVPADIWGSILAPQAMFHAHATGGHVSGNAAFRSFAVSPTSGFEFHDYPFVGGVTCPIVSPILPTVPLVSPISETQPKQICPTCPPITPCPTCPVVVPCPDIPPIVPCPDIPPCPTCPPIAPCPVIPPCPTCPPVTPCPVIPPCPTCPPVVPCPAIPPCPTCPEVVPCPECPPCPKPIKETKYVPYPVPTPYPVCPEPKSCPECPTCPEVLPTPVIVLPIPECPECPCCPECPIEPGIISGCIWGCRCCHSHEWEVELYEICNDTKTLLHCVILENCGCFEFKVAYEGCYLLKICPEKSYKKSGNCKPTLTLKNIGVSNLML